MKKHHLDDILVNGSPEKMRTEIHNLPCDLTEEEVNRYAKEAAKIYGEIDKLMDEKKSAAKQYQGRIDAKGSEIKELNRKISSSTEHRDIDCVWYADFPAGEKYLVRTDTGDVVETHPISEFERQRKLKLGADDEPGEEEKEQGSDGPEAVAAAEEEG